MPTSWTLEGLRHQLRIVSQDWPSSLQLPSPSRMVLWGLTSAIVGAACLLGNVWLLLLGIVQGVVLANVGQSPDVVAPGAMAGLSRTNWSALTLSVGRIGVDGLIVMARCLWRTVVTLTAAIAAGLATLSWFVLSDAQGWRWQSLQVEGPPLGPMLLSVGAALFTMLFVGWLWTWKPLLPLTRE